MLQAHSGGGACGPHAVPCNPPHLKGCIVGWVQGACACALGGTAVGPQAQRAVAYAAAALPPGQLPPPNRCRPRPLGTRPPLLLAWRRKTRTHRPAILLAPKAHKTCRALRRGCEEIPGRPAGAALRALWAAARRVQARPGHVSVCCSSVRARATVPHRPRPSSLPALAPAACVQIQSPHAATVSEDAPSRSFLINLPTNSPADTPSRPHSLVQRASRSSAEVHLRT